jgi:hypothetical protein
VYRLYRDDGLSLQLKKPRRNVSAANRDRQPAAPAANEIWSMDFVSDALFDGRRSRALPVSACFNANAICSSVCLVFLIFSSSPADFKGPENSHSNLMKKQGERQFATLTGRT